MTVPGDLKILGYPRHRNFRNGRPIPLGWHAISTGQGHLKRLARTLICAMSTKRVILFDRSMCLPLGRH
jgi:hypothetical protein